MVAKFAFLKPDEAIEDGWMVRVPIEYDLRTAYNRAWTRLRRDMLDLFGCEDDADNIQSVFVIFEGDECEELMDFYILYDRFF